jgi:hypothetical protein
MPKNPSSEGKLWCRALREQARRVIARYLGQQSADSVQRRVRIYEVERFIAVKIRAGFDGE